MSTSSKSARPLSYTYSLVEEFVSQSLYLIGIGNTATPWVIEGSPPEVDISLVRQPEVVIYLGSTEVQPVIPYPLPNDDTVQIGSAYYAKVGKSYREIERAGATRVLIQAKLVHAEIFGATHYRSLGVHDQVSISTKGRELLSQGKGLPRADVLASRLVFLTNIKPVQVQSNVTEFINLVVPL